MNEAVQGEADPTTLDEYVYAADNTMWDYYPQKRYGHRVTIAGTKPC